MRFGCSWIPARSAGRGLPLRLPCRGVESCRCRLRRWLPRWWRLRWPAEATSGGRTGPSHPCAQSLRRQPPCQSPHRPLRQVPTNADVLAMSASRVAPTAMNPADSGVKNGFRPFPGATGRIGAGRRARRSDCGDARSAGHGNSCVHGNSRSSGVFYT